MNGILHLGEFRAQSKANRVQFLVAIFVVLFLLENSIELFFDVVEFGEGFEVLIS